MINEVDDGKMHGFCPGGGGARGALQVGALRALFEAGLKPDLLVGTSIGAVNAAGLALWGTDVVGIETLQRAYQEVADSRIMDPRLAQFAISALARRPNLRASRRIEEFLIAEGITPDFRFGQISNMRLAMIAADLDTGQTVIYGSDPEQSVLEGVLASIALPPWFAPIKKEGHLIMDGGPLSNLPIEPALTLGATEIIALDLDDPSGMLSADNRQIPYLEKLLFSITQRQVRLEMELASARGVPVQYVSLRSTPPISIWDFKNHRKLFNIGYETMQNIISGWPPTAQSGHMLSGVNMESQPSWMSG